MEVSQSDCVSSPAPAPPPPPPLPLATFSIQLPTALQQLQQQEEISSFNTDLLNSEGELDAAMLLSPQSNQQASPDPQPPQEVTSSDNANLDLKVSNGWCWSIRDTCSNWWNGNARVLTFQELELDLETLDTMDFSQLDCDLGVKMEAPQELMDIGDMPMDMDDPDWLDSLMPQSPPTSSTTVANHQPAPPTSLSSGTDIYDPLLASSQDPFDLFNMEDSDFKMSSDLLTWDKVDFAT